MTMGIIEKSRQNYYEIQIAVQFNQCKYFDPCSHTENGDCKHKDISLVLNLHDPKTGSYMHLNVL